jgi:hypothetical protein
MHRPALHSMLTTTALAELIVMVLWWSCGVVCPATPSRSRACRAKRACGHRRRHRSNEATQPCCPVVRENEYFQPFRYKNLIDAFGLRVSLLVVSHRFFYNVRRTGGQQTTPRPRAVRVSQVLLDFN